MNFLKLLTIGARKNRIRTARELAVATGEGAAYLAQGSSYSYIRARSGTMGPKLMQDPAFGAGMDRCKWEAFAAAACDLILIAETEMRPHGATAQAPWQNLYRDILKAEKIPLHRPSGWDDRFEEFDRRLAQHVVWPPRDVEAICEHTAAVLLDFAPIEYDIRELDREMVTNNVKFRFIDHLNGLRQRADWQALAMAFRSAPAEKSG